MASSFISFITLSLCFVCLLSKPVFVEVAPGGEECYYEEYAADEMMEFLYVVKRGGQHDIELKIYTPTNNLLIQKVGSKYDRFKQKVDIQGTYKICFNNGMSRWTSKIVGIDLLGSHRPEIEHYNQLTKKRHLNTMERTIYNIGAKIDAIGRLQSLSSDMEETYEDTVISASNIASYITIIELSIVLCVYIYQIRTIRSWFKKVSKYGI